VKEIMEIKDAQVKMKNIKIKTQYLGFYDQCIIKTDQKRFQQVFLNIYANAIKFTDRNGKIFIRIERKKETLKSSVEVVENILVTIIDQGTGIKKED
jgi:signal transduction histidine kinase